MEIAPYQKNGIDKLLEFLPAGNKDILEIGSDLDCCVLEGLTGFYRGSVVGLNPSVDFPKNGSVIKDSRFHALRSDGCALPFKDKSFDAIISIATLEHVRDLKKFLEECNRVLRPGGVFYTKFSPVWSCGIGHHVFAVAGHKEARFWKPGKNPLPDFSHLIWGPDEMRSFLHSGPCDDRLIEPIISWVYNCNDINRLFLEEYISAFRKSPFKQLVLNLITLYAPPEAILVQLQAKYGTNHDFSCQGIEAVFLRRESVEELNKQGEGLFERGKIREAFNTFAEVIEIDPEFSQAYNNMGVIHCEAGDVNKAWEYFKRALDIKPDDRDAVLNCGRVLIFLGHCEDAEKLFSSYLNKNHDDEEISQLMRDLEEKNQREKVMSLNHDG
jgi:hypothetical protein